MHSDHSNRTARSGPGKVWLLAGLLAVAAGLALTGGGAGAAVGGMLTAHAHWDDPNGNYEVKLCYTVKAATPTAGPMIFHIPFREQDAPNFMDLQVTRTGMVLKRRVDDVAQTDRPTFSTRHTFGVGDKIMFDLVARGSTFTVYQLLPDKTRGPEWYSWTDPTYPLGVNISYYTVAGYDGDWDFVTARPLDDRGVGHDIKGLEQDARAVPGSGATFDSTIPAEGGVTGASTAKNGPQATYGLASGTRYTYSLTVNKAGTGHFDFRDPSSSSDGSGSYFTSSFYRLSLGSTPQIQRFRGSSPATVYRAPSGSGGAGTYTLRLDGSRISLEDASGKRLISFDDGGPQWGVRVRLAFGDQTWTWTGRIGVSGG